MMLLLIFVPFYLEIWLVSESKEKCSVSLVKMCFTFSDRPHLTLPQSTICFNDLQLREFPLRRASWGYELPISNTRVFVTVRMQRASIFPANICCLFRAWTVQGPYQTTEDKLGIKTSADQLENSQEIIAYLVETSQEVSML